MGITINQNAILKQGASSTDDISEGNTNKYFTISRNEIEFDESILIEPKNPMFEFT